MDCRIDEDPPPKERGLMNRKAPPSAVLLKSVLPKILFLGLVPPEAGGKLICGAAVHGWELARQASQRGYEVFFAANTRFRSSLVMDGVRVISLPRQPLTKAWRGMKAYFVSSRETRMALKPFRPKERIAILGRSEFLKKLLRIFKPDLIHVHSLEHAWPLCCKLVSCPIPVVTTDHGFWHVVKREKDRLKTERSLAGTARLIAVSEYGRRQANFFGLNAQTTTRVVYNPVNPDRLLLMDKKTIKRKWGFTDKKIVFFSGITESVRIKGLDILLEAFAGNESLKASSRLIVIADEEGLSRARKYARKFGLQGIFSGAETWERIQEFYNAADVCVVPSRSESFGLVYEESLLAGVPVVGFFESVRELEAILGINVGEQFNPETETSRDLARKIIQVLSRVVDRQALRERIVARLSWESEFRQFDLLYKDLINSRKGNMGG